MDGAFKDTTSSMAQPEMITIGFLIIVFYVYNK